jgi:hypothetical protein
MMQGGLTNIPKLLLEFTNGTLEFNEVNALPDILETNT